MRYLALAFLCFFTKLAFSCTPLDTLIKHAQILTLNGAFDSYADGFVAIRNGKIVGLGDKPRTQYCPRKVINARHKILMPGLINGHTHTGMLVYRGIGDDKADVLFGYMFPLEKKFMNQKTAYHSAILSAAEMIKSGITLHADMYYFADSIAKADKAIGIKGMIGETIINAPSPDTKKPYDGLQNFKKFAERYNQDSLITPTLAPHAPYSVTDPKIFHDILHTANHYHAPIFMHTVEFLKEKNKLKGSTIDYLTRQHFLPPNLSLMHCVYLSKSDLKIIHDKNIGCILNLSSNLKGANNIPDIRSMLSEGINIGLGTDGPMASANAQELWTQMKLVSMLYKYHYHDPEILPARQVLQLATLGTAKVLHIDDHTGSIELNKDADLILVDQSGLHHLPHYDPYHQLVYAATPQDVTDVMVNGIWKVRNHKLLTKIDLEKSKNFIQKQSDKIKQYLKTA